MDAAAFFVPKPKYLLSPSRSSWASKDPVDAPLGTIAEPFAPHSK